MVRRISESRPITGSNWPAAASATKSRPYLLSASYVPSGVAEGDPLMSPDLGQRGQKAVTAQALLLQQPSDADDDPSSIRAMTRCSTETYSSFSRRASRVAASIRRESR